MECQGATDPEAQSVLGVREDNGEHYNYICDLEENMLELVYHTSWGWKTCLHRVDTPRSVQKALKGSSIECLGPTKILAPIIDWPAE